MVLQAGEYRAARRDPVLRRGQKISVRDHGESVVLGVLCWCRQRGRVVGEKLLIIAPGCVALLTLRIGLWVLETFCCVGDWRCVVIDVVMVWPSLATEVDASERVG